MHIPKPAKAAQRFRTLTDWARWRSRSLLDTLGALLAGIGLHPNLMTVIGLLGNGIGALMLAQGKFLLGGIIILAMGPIDALDGATARARGESSPWGAFVDSTTDRWSEAVILLGLMVHYVGQNDPAGAVVVMLALIGSLMVSYSRARAEALGFDANVGLLTRMERYLVLVPALVLNQAQIGLWIIATLANITALQRILHVRQQWYKRNAKTPSLTRGYNIDQ